MSRVYVIKPLHKKSIVYHVEMFRRNPDDSISWFNIDETYRWGQGFVEGDLDCNLPWEGDDVAYARADVGWGCEFDDSCSIEFEFSNDIDEAERKAIREAYYEGGAAWLFDGEHEWLEEDTAVHIIAPYQVDLCDEDGTVIKENIKLKSRPDPSTSWPWSVDNPKPEDA
jgi:hypothetical protein